jgi:pentatricopeptide repeat protein
MPRIPEPGAYIPPSELPAGVVPLSAAQRAGMTHMQAQKSADVTRQLEDVLTQMRLHDALPMPPVSAPLSDVVMVSTGLAAVVPTSAPLASMAGMGVGGMKGPDAESAAYASIIKSYASVGDEIGAEEVVRQLRERNVKPDVVMYNALMSAYAMNGNIVGAEVSARACWLGLGWHACQDVAVEVRQHY